MKKVFILFLIFTNLLVAHTIFNGNEPFYKIWIYLIVVGFTFWMPAVLLIGALLCFFKACKIFWYLLGAIVAFILFIFASAFIDRLIKKEKSKPYHSFAVNCEYAEYDDKSLYKKSESKIINMFEINGYYEANGMLHCNSFDVELDANTTLRARCKYDYLYILQKNNKMPRYQLKNTNENKAKFKISDFKMRYYTSNSNRKYFFTHDVYLCSSIKNHTCYDNTNKILYINKRKIKIPKKPKFASISNDGKDLYLIYEDKPTNIYILHDSNEKQYTLVQNVAKNVINSAYVPWWSRYKAPYDTISIEQLKEIKSFSKSSKTQYYYKIRKRQDGLFDVNVTCEEEKYRFLHFIIKYEKFASKPIKLEILKKDFFTKETKELAKEFIEDKNNYYKTETILKLILLQERAKQNSSMPDSIDKIIEKNFFKALGEKKDIYKKFIDDNVCFANYYNSLSDNHLKYYTINLNFLLKDYKKYIKKSCL